MDDAKQGLNSEDPAERLACAYFEARTQQQAGPGREGQHWSGLPGGGISGRTSRTECMRVAMERASVSGREEWVLVDVPGVGKITEILDRVERNNLGLDGALLEIRKIISEVVNARLERLAAEEEIEPAPSEAAKGQPEIPTPDRDGIVRINGADMLLLSWSEVDLLMRMSGNENLVGQDGSLVGKCRHFLLNAQAEFAKLPKHIAEVLSNHEPRRD